MRDLINNYKKIIFGKTESESDAESQPLMRSESSSRSFGTVFNVSDSDFSDSDSMKSERFRKITSCVSPKIAESRLKQNLLYTPTNGSASIDILKNKQFQDTEANTYPKIKPMLLEETKLPPKVTNVQFSDSDDKDDEKATKNPSIVTIFAVWNTMLGSSLLAIAWGIEKTGLFPGILINLLIGAICLYMAYILLQIDKKHGVPGERTEVPQLCKMLLGPWAEILAKFFSLIVLVGANIVYWILMSNFLYNLISSLHGFLSENDSSQNTSVICPKETKLNLSIYQNLTNDSGQSMFNKIWNLYSTVPIVLGLILFPMLNFKNASIFVKFNSLGTISVMYLIVFSVAKAFSWGFHLPDVPIIFNLKPTFVALSGMLSLSYFIHNIIISIMKNNRHQEKNGRDMSIAFGLVTFTYTFTGGLLYMTFPIAKFCIEDNIFNNFGKYDVLVIFGRLLLLFQLLTVFPLMTFMLRNDIFENFKRTRSNAKFPTRFRYWPVILLNLALVIVCILFACFLPRIGTIIRYTGALSGMVYVFMLPNLLMIYSLKKDNNLSTCRLVFHIFIIILGILNLLSQFVISDE